MHTKTNSTMLFTTFSKINNNNNHNIIRRKQKYIERVWKSGKINRNLHHPLLTISISISINISMRDIMIFIFTLTLLYLVILRLNVCMIELKQWVVLIEQRESSHSGRYRFIALRATANMIAKSLTIWLWIKDKLK